MRRNRVRRKIYAAPESTQGLFQDLRVTRGRDEPLQIGWGTARVEKARSDSRNEKVVANS